MAVKQEVNHCEKVTIIGGNGTVGRVLAGGLAGEGYEVTVLDLKEPDEKPAVRFVRVDAADYNEVVKSIPLNTDAVINLLAVKPTGDLLDRREFEKMTDIFFKATYTILRAAAELGVPKVVFASSNHVTDVYERTVILCWGGRSTRMTTRSPKACTAC